ncbi:MAG: PucR family transcriptional regulator [Halanaerobium sp.]
MLNKEELKKLTLLQDEVTNYLLNDYGLRTFSEKMINFTGGSIYIYNRFKDDLFYLDKKLKNNEEFKLYLKTRKIIKQEKRFRCCQSKIYENTYQWVDETGQQKTEKEMEMELGGEEKVGVLVIKDFNDLNIFKYRLMIVIGHAVALKLHQNKMVTELAQKCSSELIEDLLQNRVQNQKEMVKRAKLANWNLELNYQLYLIEVEAIEKIADRETFYFYEIKERVLQLVRSYIKNNIKREYIIFSYKGSIILMINYENENELEKEDIKNILREIAANLKNYYINIGAGSFVNNAADIAESYQEASYIIDFLETTGKKNILYYYNDLGILRLLWNVEKDELRTFTNDYLSKLIDYDKGNSTDWLDTLGIYLEEGGSIKKAAERLFIHPNTMSYRIKRIKEILDIDLQDKDIQLNLSAAYKICKYILQGNIDIK